MFMRITSIAFLFLSIITNSMSQPIYKGLIYGMTKSIAVQEFNSNKETYTNIDVGNNFIYRIYTQNFVYDSGRLAGVLLTPKNSALGQSYDDAKNYLIYTRGFFEKLGYEVFLDNEWWDSPINYVSSASKWGLVMAKEDKSVIVQMYPVKYELAGNTTYIVKLMIWHYNTWMSYYNLEAEKQTEKVKDSGF